MKKSLLVFLLLLAGSTTLFAQNKPEEGHWGFTAGVSGLSNIGLFGTNFGAGSDSVGSTGTGTIGFRYILANGLTARVSLVFESAKNKNESLDNGGFGPTENGRKFTNTTTRSGGMGLSIGVSKSWEGTERLDPYIGADLRIIKFGNGKSVNRVEIVNADSTSDDTNDVTGDFSETTTKNGGGISIGIIPCVGFNYFFAKNFSFGAEFGWGFFMSSASGAEQTFESKSGSTTTSRTVDLDSKSSSTGFGTTGSATVNISFYF